MSKTLRTRAALVVATVALGCIGVARQADAGGIDYTPTCGITTSTVSYNGFKAANDNSCELVQSRILVNYQGSNSWINGPIATRTSIIYTQIGTRAGGGGRGAYNGAWGTWVS